MKTANNRKPQRDLRVTAPLISWKVLLVVLAIVYFMIVIQAFIYNAFKDQILELIGVYFYYAICASLIVAVIVDLFWRYVIGKPLRKITRAAQKVAAGDFSVQIELTRKDGKKSEIDVLIDDFNTMTRELAGNEILKTDFIANVSHEIKTPLSVIQSYTKALRDNCVSPEQREQYMDIVIEASQNLSAMITNVLKLSKLENQQIFPSPGVYQLGEQLRRCALGYMDRWLAKNIEFEINVQDVAVNYDASLLELVWNNLLSNAIKFTEPGGKVSLTSQVRGQSVFVTVCDSGCGISEEAQTRIFEKFYQGDFSHSTEGNGLGLALVARVLSIIGGELALESHPGEGTELTVALKAEK